MAVLPLRMVPDPVLRTKAKRVRPPMADAPRIQQLIDDMVESMHHYGGVGLAANQVGALYRVLVVQLPEEESVRALVNPEVVRREGERDVEEGCLSIPGYRGMVKRSLQVVVKARDRNGKPVRIKAQELLAQALEHEIDHLDGILYIDRLTSPDKFYPIKDEEAAPVEAAAG